MKKVRDNPHSVFLLTVTTAAKICYRSGNFKVRKTDIYS